MTKAPLGEIPSLTSPAFPPKKSSDKGFLQIQNLLVSDEEIQKIQSAQRRLEKGQIFTQKELLSLQIQVQEIHLKVELSSKIADCASSTIHRFQATQ